MSSLPLKSERTRDTHDRDTISWASQFLATRASEEHGEWEKYQMLSQQEPDPLQLPKES